MKKITLSILFFVAYSIANATNYYVDAVNGNNAYSGTTVQQAFKTIATAASLTYAGDTVFIMNGNYSPFNISRAGNATAQIVYTNFPGHLPKIISTSSTYLVVNITPGANYITVNGLEIIGWGVNLSLAADTIPAQAAIVCPEGARSTTNVTFIGKYNGSGISVGGSGTITHHVIISNNVVHDCAAGGITAGYSDYITIEGNKVYNNSWYTPYGLSGIAFGNAINYDNNTTTYRNIVRNNICYGNRLYVLWRGSCTISDGNGIILDIPVAGYNGRQLVANNICYNNGGSGIHAINNINVDFINNTAYMNCASPTNKGGSIYTYGCDNPTFYNNIIVARSGNPVNKCPYSTNVIYDFNVYYGGNTIDFVGKNSLIQDPKFVNASTDPAVADFHLQQSSFAVNNGTNLNTVPTDKDGKTRPDAGTVDIGAYESNFAGNLTTCSGAIQNKILGSGGGTGEPGSVFYGPYYSKAGTSNQKSRFAFIYPQTLISASVVPTNATLTSLQFRRALQSGSMQTIPDNGYIKIYVRNESNDNLGAADFDWNTVLPSAANPSVMVYGGDAASLVGNAGGWMTVNFQIPFVYTGTHLGVFVEYVQKGAASSGTDINWIYDNGGSQPLYYSVTYPNQLYGSKSTNTTGTISDLLTTNNERRPIITLGYCSGYILPVTIQQFTAIKKQNIIDINWLVSNEVNNAGFEVQRSTNGSYFESIGFVASKLNNSNNSNAYHFTDSKAPNTIIYYRLLQKDYDGKSTYSTIISVSNNNGTSGLSIFPNPVNNKLSATINVTGQNTMASMIVQDLAGRILYRFTKQLVTGHNSVEVNLSKQLPSMYLLTVELSSGEKFIEKFIKN